MKQPQRLSLNDTVRITGTDMIKASVPLDDEQIGWLIRAYQTIAGYGGQLVSIRQIDQALNLAGEPEHNWNQDYLDRYFGGQVLSLRTVRQSEADRRAVEEYEAKQESAPPGTSYWRPVVGNKRLYLISREGNQLFFGIGDPSEIDGELSFTTSDLARILYEK